MIRAIREFFRILFKNPQYLLIIYEAIRDIFSSSREERGE